eukprot:CAMPEP_0174314210 /NCGR_PEP_ID=MMETSP0810-20121108/5498_1 /TAXON_ID=73025 ORGANISM="Eutreptiella gymnastica-like, Strain CCMP1594" /NCGR_SAMPLE_ID=MMETSP0810 /ASSEMBLY_ACC=CAM_ASM_000659 /LENGTH=174 /DNA_ID=CAMNT_0015423247 /DNA_START=396 /DNA_END=922 /DNA_ORIENTATION=-
MAHGFWNSLAQLRAMGPSDWPPQLEWTANATSVDTPSRTEGDKQKKQQRLGGMPQGERAGWVLLRPWAVNQIANAAQNAEAELEHREPSVDVRAQLPKGQQGPSTVQVIAVRVDLPIAVPPWTATHQSGITSGGPWAFRQGVMGMGMDRSPAPNTGRAPPCVSLRCTAVASSDS